MNDNNKSNNDSDNSILLKENYAYHEFNDNNKSNNDSDNRFY